MPPDGQEATPPSWEHSRAQTAPVIQRSPVSQAPPVQQPLPALPHSEPPCPPFAGPQLPFAPPCPESPPAPADPPSTPEPAAPPPPPPPPKPAPPFPVAPPEPKLPPLPLLPPVPVLPPDEEDEPPLPALVPPLPVLPTHPVVTGSTGPPHVQFPVLSWQKKDPGVGSFGATQQTLDVGRVLWGQLLVPLPPVPVAIPPPLPPVPPFKVLPHPTTNRRATKWARGRPLARWRRSSIPRL